MSHMVVINGALAVAGSNLRRVKTKGNSMPTTLPTTTIRTIVSDTTGIISGARHDATTETPTAIVRPSRSATANSLLNKRTQSLPRTSPFPSDRIISVADCEPAFPPLSIRRGRKNTNETMDSITVSKRDIA